MLIFFLLCFYSFAPSLVADNLETIYADSVFTGPLEIINDKEGEGESWMFAYYPVTEGIPVVSSYLPATEKDSYGPWNTEDYDLNTAWIPCKRPKGIGEYIEFVFRFPEDAPTYGAVYQFNGMCAILNGYCKSAKLWEEHCRVKKLKVSYNGQGVCYVVLQDNWYVQEFDLRKFFKNRSERTYLGAPYEIVNGDRLRFEIVEVYEGSRYEEVAISELLCTVGGN